MSKEYPFPMRKCFVLRLIPRLPVSDAIGIITDNQPICFKLELAFKDCIVVYRPLSTSMCGAKSILSIITVLVSRL